jgi:hypothetical protein
MEHKNPSVVPRELPNLSGSSGNILHPFPGILSMCPLKQNTVYLGVEVPANVKRYFKKYLLISAKLAMLT